MSLILYQVSTNFVLNGRHFLWIGGSIIFEVSPSAWPLSCQRSKWWLDQAFNTSATLLGVMI